MVDLKIIDLDTLEQNILEDGTIFYIDKENQAAYRTRQFSKGYKGKPEYKTSTLVFENAKYDVNKEIYSKTGYVSDDPDKLRIVRKIPIIEEEKKEEKHHA